MSTNINTQTTSTTVSNSTSDSVPAPQTESAPESTRKFVNHLQHYPLVMAAKSGIQKLPYASNAANTISPFIRDSEAPFHLEFVCKALDDTADGVLTQVDRFAPCLKTTQVSDLVDPIRTPAINVYAFGLHVINTGEMLWDDNITKPTNKIVQELDNAYKQLLINDHGKNAVLTPIDPLVKPLNDTMEQMVHVMKPATKKVDSKTVSSEISRTKQIVWNFLGGVTEEVPSIPPSVPVEPEVPGATATI